MGSMGCGYAQMILDGRAAGLELAAVTRIRRDKAQWAAEHLPGHIPVFHSGEELLAHGGLDAVIVATPHYSHETFTVEALNRGLHVLCDKPAGVYTLQAERMNQAAAAHPELVYAMMFNQRTDPRYRKIRELVQGGTYGGLKRVSWIITDWYRTEAYYKSSAWRATWAGEGGGVLINQCPHNLDLLQWMCGMPCRVQAFCHEGKWHDIEVEDDVTAYMEFPNGATGTFVTSTGDAPGVNRLEIDLEDAQIICENKKLRMFVSDVHEPDHRRQCGDNSAKPPGKWLDLEPEGENPKHPGILRNFAAAILRGEPLIAPGAEGIRSLMLSNAMYLSSWEGRMAELPVDGEAFYEALRRHMG